MSTVPATLVKELRELTGAGMMDCKRALQEADGDLEAARKLLRERGIAQAGKRAGRETTEGKVGYHIADSHASMVAIGCETEPVSNNDEFLAYGKRVLDAVHEGGLDAAAALEEERIELVAKLGENIVVRGATRLERTEGETITGYAHPPLNKIGVLVKARGGADEALRNLAMHIAASRPLYRTRGDVPETDVAAERAIYEKQPDVLAKPESVRERIVDGMIGKRFFAESVLEDQAWVREPSKTVAQALAGEGVEVLEFVRYAVAE